MQGIILKKKPLNDDSALLDMLLENGYRKKIKLPGILKSKKRSAFFLTPSSIWDFTLKEFSSVGLRTPEQNICKEVLIPQESLFVSAPYRDSPSYQELLQISWLLLPITSLCMGYENQNIFFYYQKIIDNWPQLDEQQKLLRVLYFSLLVLTENGFLNSEPHCQICAAALQASDIYIFNKGGICSSCFSMQKENSIPFAYISFLSQTFSKFVTMQKNLKKDFALDFSILVDGGFTVEVEKHLRKIQDYLQELKQGL